MNEIKITDRLSVWEGFPDGSRAVLVSDGKIHALINPPAADTEVYRPLIKKYSVKAVYLSDRNYSQAFKLRMEFKIPFGVHELEDPFLQYPADFTFKDGHNLLCGLKPVHLLSQASEGECVFYLADGMILIAGRVLSSNQDGLKMRGADDYSDYRKAQAGLRRLFSLKAEVYLPSSGPIILEQANQKLDRMFDELR